MDANAIQKVVIVGSGTMGPGIAMTFARAGLTVFLVDVCDNILERALQRIREYLEVFLETEVIEKKEVEPIFSRICATTDLEGACKQADYFMEAVQEILALKQKVHQQADQWCRPQTIFATNASNMKIEHIAQATNRPDRVVGTHWVNPPHIMQLVEVVRGASTSEVTVHVVQDFLQRVGKAPIVCQDSLSYLNNAMQIVLTKAALDLLEKGVATAEDIDRAVNTGFGFRLPIVGPLAFLDMAGLDNVRDSWEYLNRMTGGTFGAFPKFLQKLVDKGDWGLKTGKGIYQYSAEEVRKLAKERNRQLILQLKALGRL